MNGAFSNSERVASTGGFLAPAGGLTGCALPAQAGVSTSSAFLAPAGAEEDSPRGILIEEVDGIAPSAHPIAPYLAEAGLVPGALGFQAPFRT